MPEMDPICRLIRRWERLRDEQSVWNEHYDDLARVMLPRRIGFASTTIEGERRTDDIFDGTPMQGARGLANSVGTMLRPKGGLPDVEMEAENDELNDRDEAKEWFSDSVERLERAFANPAAHYVDSAAETEADLVVFGTASLFELESKAK